MLRPCTLHSTMASATRLSMFRFGISQVFSAGPGLTGHSCILALKALNTGTATAFARTSTSEFRADAERLSDIVLEMQRCFVLHLCKELAPGNVSFPQFFLLAYLDQKEVLTMTAIAQKMGHTTAAASGLVARLENLGMV